MENTETLPTDTDPSVEPQPEPIGVSEEDAYAAAAAIEEMSQPAEDESAEQPVPFEDTGNTDEVVNDEEAPAPSALEPLTEEEAQEVAATEDKNETEDVTPVTFEDQPKEEEDEKAAPQQREEETTPQDSSDSAPVEPDSESPAVAVEDQSPAPIEAEVAAESEEATQSVVEPASVRPVSSKSRPTSVIEARVPSAVMETDGAKAESPTGRKSVTFNSTHTTSRPTSSASRPVTGSQRGINPTPPPRPPSAANRPTSGRPKSSLRQSSASASRPTSVSQAISSGQDIAQSPIAEEATPVEHKESAQGPQTRPPSAPASRPQTAARSRVGTASQAARPSSGVAVQQVSVTEEPSAAPTAEPTEQPIVPTPLDIEIRVPAGVLGVKSGGVSGGETEAAWRENVMSTMTVDELRALVAKKIEIHEAAIAFAIDGISVEDGATALDAFKSKYFQTTADAQRPSFTVVVTVKSHVAPTAAQQPASSQPSAEEPAGEQFDLNVVVPAEHVGEQPTVVHVKVEREGSAKSKPFVGGFKNKLTGQQFHNAMTQTASTEHNPKGIEKYHRDAQTVDVTTRSQQTTKEAGTQMVRKDLYKDGAEDVVKEVNVGRYVTSEELHAIKEDKAIRIQSFLRQCFALRRVRHLRDQRDARVAEELREKEREEAESQAERQRQIERRVHPRTKEDFEILHGELEAWRMYETERIKNQDLSHMKFASREDRDAYVHKQLQELLLKEVRLLQTIDRLRLEAMKVNKEDATAKTLEMLAQPKRWGSRTEPDRAVQVETPYTSRAHDLVELYHGLTLTTLTRTQRLELLHSVKWTVKEFECELTREIEALLDRETDMLNRGRSEASLLGLRKRLNSLFLQFAQTPEFNPEAANLAAKKKQSKLQTRAVKVL